MNGVARFAPQKRFEHRQGRAPRRGVGGRRIRSGLMPLRQLLERNPLCRQVGAERK